MVTFLSGRLRCFSIAEHLPGIHRLAYMDSPVIDQIHLHHFVAVGFQEFGYGPSQEVVPDVSQMERFVGIRRRKFHHNSLASSIQLSVIL